MANHVTASSVWAPHRARRLLGAAFLVGTLLVLLQSRPAEAHSGGPQPSNYSSRVLGVAPPQPGLTVEVVDAGSRLQLTNTGPNDVTVLGYAGEPYLRVGPRGVFENTRSPAAYLNKDLLGKTKVPAVADPKAAPVWRRIGGGPVAAWHDHRAHWMGETAPPQVAAAPGQVHVINPRWTVALRAGDRPVRVTGDLRWVPGPSPWPWVGLAVGCLLLALLAGRLPSWPALLGVLVAVLLVVNVVHTAGVLLGTSGTLLSKVPALVLSLAWWALGAVAVWRLLRGPDASWGLIYLLLTAALVLIAGGLEDMPELVRSQLPGALSDVLARATVAVTLGLALGLLISGALRLWQSQRQDRNDSLVATGMLDDTEPTLRRINV
jgi:hypothetical protein